MRGYGTVFTYCWSGSCHLDGWIYTKYLCLISGFCRDVDEICALLRYYAASSGKSAPTFRDNLPNFGIRLAIRRCVISQNADLMVVNVG